MQWSISQGETGSSANRGADLSYLHPPYPFHTIQVLARLSSRLWEGGWRQSSCIILALPVLYRSLAGCMESSSLHQEGGGLYGEYLLFSSHFWDDWIQFSLSLCEDLGQLCSQASLFSASFAHKPPSFLPRTRPALLLLHLEVNQGEIH